MHFAVVSHFGAKGAQFQVRMRTENPQQNIVGAFVLLFAATACVQGRQFAMVIGAVRFNWAVMCSRVKDENDFFQLVRTD